jgi:thymidylate synthase (FAD)
MKVELISKTVGEGKYTNLSSGEIIAAVARHGTIKEDNGRLVKYLMDHKHWSPLQHISFGFLIETRRSISAQIFRHRSLNGQEWSLRYSEPIGYEAIDFREEHPTNRQSSTNSIGKLTIDTDGWSYVGDHNHKAYNAIAKAGHALSIIDEAYNALIEAGVAKECVRDILPLATKTTIHITGTLRDLLGFLNVRCDEHAQKEVRDIATRIGEELEKELPDVMVKINWRNGLFM